MYEFNVKEIKQIDGVWFVIYENEQPIMLNTTISDRTLDSDFAECLDELIYSKIGNSPSKKMF